MDFVNTGMTVFMLMFKKSCAKIIKWVSVLRDHNVQMLIQNYLHNLISMIILFIYSKLNYSFIDIFIKTSSIALQE